MKLLRAVSRIAALGLAAATLTACTIVFVFDPDIDATLTAQATASPSALVEDEFLLGRESVFYRVSVPVARDLLYLEAVGADLRVTVYTVGGSTLGMSETPDYFAASVFSLAAEGDVLAPAAIDRDALSVAFTCLGPCVAIPPSASSYVVEVENRANGGRTMDFYAYTFDATDQFEPNGSSLDATPLFAAGAYTGATELLGDVDWFEYDAPGPGDYFVVFTPVDLALGLELEIVTCPQCPVLDGDQESVLGLLDGDMIRVRSVAGRAGPSANSSYTVEVTQTPPLSVASRR